MRHATRIILTLALCSTSGVCLNAQEKPNDPVANNLNVDKILNTIKERVYFEWHTQFGFHNNADSPDKNNTMQVRLAVLYNELYITKKMTACFMYEFRSGTLLECWLDYNFSNPLNIRIGRVRTPYTRYNYTFSASRVSVIDFPLAIQYFIAGMNDMMMPGSVGRDHGAVLYGDLYPKRLTYYMGVSNGTGIHSSDKNQQKDYSLRLVYHPTSWLDIEASGLIGTGWVDNTQYEYGTGGIKHNGNFSRNRWAISAEGKQKKFHFMTEYLAGRNANDHASGYYASFTLKDIQPKFDMYCRYDYLDSPEDCLSRYTAGLQYWFYPKCRFRTEYAMLTSNSDSNKHIIRAQVQIKF